MDRATKLALSSTIKASFDGPNLAPVTKVSPVGQVSDLPYKMNLRGEQP